MNNSLNNYDLSILDISNCEAILKEKYHLNEDDDLIILKKEKQSNKASEKEVQLEIFEPHNKTKLNLSYCEKTNINMYVKAKLSEETKYSYEKLKSLGYDIFNVNDPFYQDICIKYTSYRDTDIILSDRIKYIYDNDDTRCQPNCKTSKYSEESEYLNCSCAINEEVNNMNKKFSSKKVFESFYDVLKYSNYKVLKCYNLVFSKYIWTNTGSYIIICFILVYLASLTIFIIKGINPLKKKIKLNFENRFQTNDLDNNNNNNNVIINNKTDINSANNKNLSIFYPQKNELSNLNFNNNKIINYNNNNNDNNNENNNENNGKKSKIVIKIKRKKTKNTRKINTKLDSIQIINSNLYHNSNNKINDLSLGKDSIEKSSSKINDKNENEIKDKLQKSNELVNLEMNELDFSEAIKLDNRTFIQIYFDILKRELLILFTFFVCDDYNLIYIKSVRFIFLISTDMVMNAFFFSDESMHKLYISYGKYDFVQQIPQMLYSNIISKIVEILLCYLSLTDKPIYKIKKFCLNYSLIKKEFKFIHIKLIIFYIFTFIFMVFYWYVVSAFCVVYKNTQIAFIKDWIFCLLLGILLSLAIYIIPSGLRICAIKNSKWKGSIFIYKLSEIIPIF